MACGNAVEELWTGHFRNDYFPKNVRVKVHGLIDESAGDTISLLATSLRRNTSSI
jgi:hypothetical protein